MTNNNTDSGFIIDNPDRDRLRLTVLKGRLEFEIKTNGRITFRGPSSIKIAQSIGYEGPKSRQKALDWVIAELEKSE